MSRRRRRPPSQPLPSGPVLGLAPSYERDYHRDFPSELLNNRRTITVSLPPGYHADERARYPVLYLHDGQNLFEHHEAAFGVSWLADATAARLLHAGRIRPVILVGIANTPDRLHEYAVHHEPHERAGGRGDLYARFVFEELKPWIDRRYRTSPDRRDTGVAGSSLGGLVSLTMARSHHEQFALCGVLSPSLWWAQGRLLGELAEEDLSWMRRMRFWLDMGTREGGRGGHVSPGIERTRRLVALFDRAGLVPGRDYVYWEVAGGEHNEANWGARFDKMLLYFFAA
jgi:predicted alpha/beta superfamily hydrolase